MTNEELDQLQAMTPWQRVKKYFPLLEDGKINQHQYIWAINGGRTILPDHEIKEITAIFNSEIM